jgi:fructose-specific phosphotransferase system IIC component
MSFLAISVAATSGVSDDKSGLASGLLNTAQQIGGALGLAILSGVAASGTKASLADAGALAANPVVQAVATVNGFHNALIAGVWFALAASFMAFVIIKPAPVSATAGVPAPAMH